jgi:hypothetical protein
MRDDDDDTLSPELILRLKDSVLGILDELHRTEALARAVREAPLDTRKDIAHATALTHETLEHHRLFNKHMRTAMEAIQEIQLQQMARFERLEARLSEIRLRWERVEDFVLRLEGLVARAEPINARMAEASALQRGHGDFAAGGVMGALDDVQNRLADIVAEATALAHESREENFIDLAERADTVRDHMLALCNRVTLLQHDMKTN